MVLLGYIDSTELRYAATFKAELEAFARENFGVSTRDINEEVHVRGFLEHCAARPRLHSDGASGMIHGPIRRTLPHRVQCLQWHTQSIGSPYTITDLSIEYARDLRNRYAPTARQARPLTPNDVRQLLQALDVSYPNGARMKALILLYWDTWARPNELLARRYPQELDDTDSRGIVLTVPTSKENRGPTPEYFTVKHDPDTELCAVCALREWLAYLGPNWTGPLFPSLWGYRVSTLPMSTTRLEKCLSTLVRRVWGNARHYTPYSFRRGAATTAASRNWDPKQIQTKLRHDSALEMFTYIDTGELFSHMDTMR